jgi:hypothetical protein
MDGYGDVWNALQLSTCGGARYETDDIIWMKWLNSWKSQPKLSSHVHSVVRIVSSVLPLVSGSANHVARPSLVVHTHSGTSYQSHQSYLMPLMRNYVCMSTALQQLPPSAALFVVCAK